MNIVDRPAITTDMIRIVVIMVSTVAIYRNSLKDVCRLVYTEYSLRDNQHFFAGGLTD